MSLSVWSAFTQHKIAQLAMRLIYTDIAEEQPHYMLLLILLNSHRRYPCNL
jgi:hypothetical protein